MKDNYAIQLILMPSKKSLQNLDQKNTKRTLNHLRIISYSAFIISVIALVTGVLILFVLAPNINTSATTVKQSSGSLMLNQKMSTGALQI